MCNKCNNNDCTCINDTCSPLDAKCVIYKPDGISILNCITEIEAGSSLETILEKWDLYFCSINNVAIINCVKEKLGIDPDVEYLNPAQLLTSIQNWICNTQDVKVKVSPADSTNGYLFDKVDTGDCLVKTIVIDGDGQQKLKISIDYPCLSTRINTCFEIKTSECIIIDDSQKPCVPQPTFPTVSRLGNVLRGTNCNGSLQWYNSNDVIIGVGNNITVEGNQYYYAKCVTACGESAKSDGIQVPPIQTFTKTRSAVFTRNNCGETECNAPCVGTSTTFSRTYSSTVSQEVANSLAENDTSFAIDGQAYINTTGSCNCPSCNCTFPIYNSNIIVNNSTCNGNIVVANGQITIAGIQNADKFGYSYGAGDYAGVGYASAITLNNFNQGNIETTPTSIKLKSLSTETRVIFRIYNGAADCYRDVVVTPTPPNCTQEQVNIEDVSISCSVSDTICKRYNVVVGNAVGGIWFVNCNTLAYEFDILPANEVKSYCSTIKPQVQGAVATENGVC